MRIFWVANDVPYPANSGGRVDVWRRLNAAARSGHEIFLTCWHDVGRSEWPSQEVIAELLKTCSGIRIIPIYRDVAGIVRRLRYLGRLPSHAASRYVSAKDSDDLRGDLLDFSPEIVFLDGLYGGELARSVARRSRIPMCYRSHNIEFLYMKQQAALEGRLLRRLGLLANLIGLKKFEASIVSSANWVFDISEEDAEYWRATGCLRLDWLPAIVDNGFSENICRKDSEDKCGILYFGNLNTPNNVDAIRWLVEEVMPNVPKERCELVLAGSNPTDYVLSLAKSVDGVRLIANPSDMTDLIASAAVIVNPMRAGSGVNLKSVEMLYSSAGLVSTSVGVKGLPSQVKQCFLIADNAKSFAQAIVTCMSGATHDLELRARIRDMFSESTVVDLFNRRLNEIHGSEFSGNRHA